MSARLLIGLILAALLALPTVALGATKNGITPTSPKAGKTIAVGKRPTMKGRVNGPGQVYVHVCKKAKKNNKGVICNKEAIFRAFKKTGTLFQGKAKFYDYTGFWLNSPGTYYWQAHRIQCEGSTSDCLMEGPIVKFRVG